MHWKGISKISMSLQTYIFVQIMSKKCQIDIQSLPFTWPEKYTIKKYLWWIYLTMEKFKKCILKIFCFVTLYVEIHILYVIAFSSQNQLVSLNKFILLLWHIWHLISFLKWTISQDYQIYFFSNSLSSTLPFFSILMIILVTWSYCPIG